MKLGGYEIKYPVALAPMAGITDLAFRTVCRQFGADYTISEMVSTRGMFYGDRKSAELITFSSDEHPFAVQLFGSVPSHFSSAIKSFEKSGADIIDINMGCPVSKVVKNGDGCALMKDIDKSAAILHACVNAGNLPVSVKFRKGWDESAVNAVEFAKMAEQCGVSFITVHGRTRCQLYSGKADWDIIAAVKKAVSIPVIGNGDITDEITAKKLLDYTGCDGIMIGRAALGNPWIFKNIKAMLKGKPPAFPPLSKRLCTAYNHIKLMAEHKGEKRGVLEGRKHLAWYLKGIHGAAELKNRASHVSTLSEVALLLESALDKNQSGDV